ncbi:LysR substrate-binding domain-containing protein [Burkholderia pseudomultivorans]|uniref:HTH-type transcriptional activator CmpR n=2 Tax=Burkholderia TaxID=32008 RepID=A0A132EIS6_9BURK|nr:LysR substrate-binding domain-containing protein [Burkholderia pseudomultivorans]KWF30758.1 LysR family transcriptional regulator [Burkholderia pseudomultivorans]MDR8732137.1 HTH-type transcriptional activator CmpR [Burkholderia pseudomultivorans]MDR8737048.1 HTH-type transcriptional activator CmpR [Burkholderia pseudomultivorans]MDR8743057.1 HTH-type transcriptional activator CmpR [Burkholderia pseudomultivorans]MDR8754431.1 HTH-type transcriptional activator CmpR [Burkholderia pseudomulti
MLALLLAAFYETARQGSVTAAAKRLDVSQPTITSRIQQLERHYGVELFHRRGNRLDLSDAGASLMPMIGQMLQIENDIDFALRNERELQTGNLRVGTTGPFYILPAIAAFRRQYPAVKISIEIGNSQQVLDALVDFRVDVAVSSQRDVDPRFVRHTIANDPLVAVVHRSHPLASRATTTLAALAHETLLLREPGSRTRALMEHVLQQAGIALPASVIELGSREAIREAVRHDMGCTLMPRGEVGAHPELRAIALADDMPHMHEYLYYLDARADTRLITAFMANVRCGDEYAQSGAR